jgi:SAM-dependent methyltransferase
LCTNEDKTERIRVRKLLRDLISVQMGGVSFRLPRPTPAATSNTLMHRSETPRDYAICGGKQGKDRLNLLARVLLPTTAQLLTRVGLRRGMKCLDLGCGGGHVTLLMAGVVGPQGRVIGTDADAEILA